METCIMKVLSSLTKVFPDQQEINEEEVSLYLLQGNTGSFQIAYQIEEEMQGVRVEVESVLEPYTKIRQVGLVPSSLPAYAMYDEGYLRVEPGFFPDPLYELEKNKIKVTKEAWGTLWIDVCVPKSTLQGNYEIKVKLVSQQEKILGEKKVIVHIVNALLSTQKLIHTEWFYTDCLADYYQVEAFSEAHWQSIREFIRVAVKRGMNMILTPLFTPPLDTAVGGERTTVQLIQVSEYQGKYQFDFSRLERWVKMCQEEGIQYFEMSHLFTQWGAQAAPKVVINVEGVEKRVFGWDTPATGEAYTQFLAAFLPELIKKLKELSIEEVSYFHISDEPQEAQLEAYCAAKNSVMPYLEGMKVIDALSDYSFYERGIIEKPIPANNHIEPFLAHQVPGLWTYYCCGQGMKVSNRFMALASYRNRILGVQLYKYNIEGFLHWGYNFYNSQYSIRRIDPFQVTDAGGAFPSGDAFLVYPGENYKPIESIRIMVLQEALEDLRLLQQLEEATSRDHVLEMIEQELGATLTFSEFPNHKEGLIELRKKVVLEIEKVLQA